MLYANIWINVIHINPKYLIQGRILMEEYASPKVEVVTFDDTGIISASNSIPTTEEELPDCEAWD